MTTEGPDIVRAFFTRGQPKAKEVMQLARRKRFDIYALAQDDAESILKHTPSVRLFTVDRNLLCRKCGRRGPLQFWGQWWPALMFRASVISAGGSLAHTCPECEARGLTVAMEGLPRAFSPVTDSGRVEEDAQAVYEEVAGTCAHCGHKGLVRRYGRYDRQTEDVTPDHPHQEPFCPHCGTKQVSS